MKRWQRHPAGTIRGVVRSLILLLSVAVLAGCSTRRVLRIDSNPPGAHIWVNGIALEKRTPVEVPFTHVGRFDVRLERQGYRSLATTIEIEGGIEDYPVIDLFFEQVQRERRYERVIAMEPLGPEPSEGDAREIVQRAETFRQRTYREAGEAEPPERFLPSTGILP
jgi:hypothetical protein